MKYLILLAWCAAISIAGGQASILPDSDREEYLERLRQLREQSDSKIEARFRVAIQAYRSAMGSDDAAHALYMKCVEKVDFTDRNRRSQEFREWRRSNDERLKDSAFRRALRHQLRWLVLTLQATSPEANRRQLASSAQDIVDSIVSDASNLTGHQNILNQSVTGSIFARAYDIGNIDVEEWVMSPGRIAAIYEQIIMPEYRITRRADALRSAWNKRIQQQTRLAEEWDSGNEDRRGRIGLADAMRSAEFQSFLADEVPDLQWKMEVDVFKHGDPAGAASRMLAHLGRHADHSNIRDWVDEFEELLTVKEAPARFPDDWENGSSDPPPQRTQPSAPSQPNPPADPPPAAPSNPDSIFID